MGVSTRHEGSIGLEECDRCTEDYCYSHSTGCDVLDGFTVVCRCRFGYIGLDRCHYPWTFLLLGLALAVLFVLFGIALRIAVRRQKKVIERKEALLSNKEKVNS